jgi:membrane-associated phospholipid phosphatase
MIRFHPRTRTLIIRLPHWRDRRWLLALLFLLVVDILVSYVDRPVAEAMRGLDPDIIRFFRNVTELGDSKYYLVPVVLLLPFLLATRQALAEGSLRRMLTWGAQALLFFFTAVAASGLLVQFLKGIIGRTRPKLWFNEGEYGFAPFNFGEYDYNSFPSGHSATVFAVAVALGFFWPQARRWLLIVALLTALSRVIVSSHYPADILAGAVVASIFTLWLRSVFARKGWVFVRRQGVYRIAAPGHLLGVKFKLLAHKLFGWRDGARGRLP